LIETKLEIKEYEPSKISKPNIIVGVPEAGLVGTISASYLIQQLKLPEAGYIDSELVPPVVVVHDSKPKRPIRIFGRDDVVIIASEVPLNPKALIRIRGRGCKMGQDKKQQNPRRNYQCPF